jgi:hypothetical protein
MKELDLPRQNNLRKIYTQVKKLPESSIEKFIKLLIYLLSMPNAINAFSKFSVHAFSIEL